ncbi:MAG: sugar transferase [Azospirillaceae bacterium]|nr:sugar transferase [Azospirillaceae bacterium]
MTPRDVASAAVLPKIVAPETRSGPVPPAGVAAMVLAAGDLAVLIGAVLAAVLVRLELNEWFPILIGARMFLGVLTAVALLPLVFALCQFYPGYGQTGVERLRHRVNLTLLWFGAMILFDYLAQNGQWSRGILLIAAAIAVLILPAWDGVARMFLIRRGWWGEAAVVLGPESRRQAVMDTLLSHPELGWIPVAGADFSDLASASLPPAALALVILHGSDFSDRIENADAADDLPYPRVVLIPETRELQSLWVSVRDLGTHLGLEMQRNLLVRRNKIIKRAMDLMLGSLALVAAVPLILVAAALVVVVSPGPVLFAQTRIGLDGRRFRIWKLRTMVRNADTKLAEMLARSAEMHAEWNLTMKLRHDPRVIPGVGAILRRFSIDELPQFWNVVRGDMSLVGPRPLPLYHVAQLSPSTERIRRKVRPGITGIWQVSGRSDTGLDGQQHLDNSPYLGSAGSRNVLGARLALE